MDISISAFSQAKTSSLQQAVGIEVLSKSMNRYTASAADLIEGMLQSSVSLEKVVIPHKGANIDITL